MSSAEAERAPGERAGARWRFLVTPRWLGWHALVLVLVCGMLALGWWQYRRAMAGNALSWAYTFEWPVFAIFGVVFWAKTIRDEMNPPDAPGAPDRAELAVGAGRSGGPPAAGAAAEPAEPGDQAEDEDLAAYNAYLARLHDQVKDHGRWHGLR